MKKILAILLPVLMVLLTACSSETNTTNTKTENNSTGSIPTIEEQLEVGKTDTEFNSLSDPDLQRYVGDVVYSDLVYHLADKGYFIEDVETRYVSKEYLEELAYNSKENVYFGYTPSELDKQFKGEKYVFTLGKDGTTVVQAFQDYDDTYEKAIKNVAIGTGVILICVTVSVATGGAAPAVSMVFAASAKSAATFALSSGTISGVASGIVTGIKSKDFDAALKSAAANGSEAFKWGAFSGALAGGAGEAARIHGATANGLSMNEAAAIQKESKYPLDVIKQFHSMEEYQVYKDAGLTVKMINGKTALVQKIDLNYVSELGGKRVSNLERMKQGYAPIDPATGKGYQLHHIGQKADGTLAVLKEAEHQGKSGVLNIAGNDSEINRQAFSKVRKVFWKDFAAKAL